MDLWLIFLTGLTVGGLTCLTVQGGLLASTVVTQVKNQKKPVVNFSFHAFPVLSFLAAKLIGYTILGFLLGALGQTLAISPNIQIIMQIIAGLYMLAVALNLLNLHPIFGLTMFSPPRAFSQLVAEENQSKSIFAPAILGLLTVFIPCGTTLAIEALAISSSNPIVGALMMAVFVLGTIPLFFSIGYLTSALGVTFRRYFLKLSAFIVIYLAIISINGALVAAGSSVTLQKIYEALPFEIDLGGRQSVYAVPANNGVQTVTINVGSSGYSPDYLQVKKGQPVHLTVVTNGNINCASSNFKIPELNISQNLSLNGTKEINFTPTTIGKLTFTCPLGLYTGTIEVI